ncbi:MAG: DegT/DnrJ/EryC1/StrS aminotransferase family protein [Spirochaetales bacterium]|nr:DegT/DnrJ/EryC1/StrS aminotransferase family protein [Spirochaetales bacterium]
MISVYKPTIKRKDMDSVLTCMVSEEIGAGTVSHQFSSKMSSYLGVYSGIAVSNYYNTLSLACDALELEPASPVIVSALAPQFYLKILHEKGFIPLIVDVDLDSCTLPPEEVEKKMHENPKAILLHYHLGFVPDIEALSSFGIPIIADISQALGSKKEDVYCGSEADCIILSLEPENIITTGGGGLILTPKRKIYSILKDMGETSRKHILLSDMNASLGLTQLKDIDSFISRRKEIEKVYSQSLMKSRHSALKQHQEIDPPFFSFPVILSSGMNDVRKYARRKNIETLPAFWDSIIAVGGEFEAEFKNAKKISMCCLLFPLYPMLGSKDISLISRILSTLP